MSRQRVLELGIWVGEPSIEPLAGGLSNESWKVVDDEGAHVVRFGQDFPFHHVTRDREVMIARAAHAAGFSPQVEHAVPGVMVSQFIEGRTWSEADMRGAPDRIASLLHDFHHDMPRHVSGPGYIFWVFHVIRDYARILEAGGSSFAEGLPQYLTLGEEMEASQVPMPIIFGHNDLLPANFLDDGKRLWLIDFEYAGFSTAMFDLAGAASNSGMSDDEATRMLAGYFGELPSAQVMKAFDAMQCASLLREAMWAMVSQLHLAAPGADYDAYARENLARLDAAIERYRSKHGKKPT